MLVLRPLLIPSSTTTAAITTCDIPEEIKLADNPEGQVHAKEVDGSQSPSEPDVTPVEEPKRKLEGPWILPRNFWIIFRFSEFTFKPVNQTQFSQGETLNGNIVTNAVCNILKNNCKASDAANQACEAGKTAFAATFNATGSISQKGAAAADAFNNALGFKTNLAVVQSAPGGGPGNAAEQAKANFNKYSPPTIVFAIGIDGRSEASFVPENRTEDTQGSALNGNIVTRAVWGTLVNKCDANVVAINDFATAQQVTAGLSG